MSGEWHPIISTPFTFDVLFHFEVVLKEEDTAALSEAAAEHSIVLDPLLVDECSRLVQHGRVDHVAGKEDPVRRQEADAAGQERDGQKQETDGACQTHCGWWLSHTANEQQHVNKVNWKHR